MRYLFFTIALMLLSGQIALAQISSNAFSIRTFIVSDTTPPTTPVLLTADPIASTQINLTWSASTDDYSVSGYVVFRDGTSIATTTLLSYSDTGLMASTTYSYTVRAFDIALNYSSSSNSLSATTLGVTPPATNTNGGGQGGTIARVVLENFWIDTGLSTTSLNIQTALSARIEVRWGRTTSYELGYVMSDVYRKEHRILLTDLEPGTTYEYEIIGYTPHGTPSVIKSGQFTTLNKYPATSPTNVSRFQAVPDGDNVNLSWQLPANENISYVRIVRSHIGFPLYPQDGSIVYQGKGESVRDVGVLAQYSPVYFTAFSYDVFGNVSSGAVALVYATKPSTSDQLEGEFIDVPTPPISAPSMADEATSSIKTNLVTVEMKMPKLSDILITQNDKTYSFIDTDIIINSEDDFLISIPRTAIAGNLKSIIVTILDPTNNKNAYSYLLRINQDQTFYQTMIPALNVAGRSQFKLEIYDYEALVVATYQVPITFSYGLMVDEEVLFPDVFYKSPYFFWSIIILLLLMAIVIFLAYRRKGEDK